MSNLEFTKPYVGARNYVLTLDDHRFISFNPDVSAVPLRAFGALLGEDNESEMETAIVQKGSEPRCRVLKGDHREAFKTVAVHGWEAVEALYHELAHVHRSKWSEDLPIVISTEEKSDV